MWIKETSLCCYQFGKNNVFMYKETYTNALFNINFVKSIVNAQKIQA